MRFQFDGMVGGVMEDYVRKKTLQGGRHIESATGAFGEARPFDEANIAAYTGEGVNLTGAPIIARSDYRCNHEYERFDRNVKILQRARCSLLLPAWLPFRIWMLLKKLTVN